jgi:hypothetical protein
MIRKILLAAAAACLVSACGKPATKEVAPPGSEPQTEAVPAPASPPSAPHDWHFVAHGGSADLDFGDGDWAEGASDFHLSCLPNSQKVEVSWQGWPDPSLFGASGAEATWHANDTIATDDPVLKAFRATGSIRRGSRDMQSTMQGSAAGKAEVEKFFAYCTTAQPAD